MNVIALLAAGAYALVHLGYSGWRKEQKERWEMIQQIAKDPNEYEKLKKLAGATKSAESSKGGKMYFYIIENNGLEHIGLLEDKYDIGDPFRLYQEEGEVTQDKNGEEVRRTFPKDVYGTIVDMKLVSEGDVIDGHTVVKIYEDEVEFEQDGKRWTQKEGEDHIRLRQSNKENR